MLREPANVLHDIWTQHQKVQILFVEGLDMWCKDITDMRTVVKLLTPLQQFAEARHLAVIGTVGSPKMKARDGYKAPRDRAIGSSVWARKAETVLDIVEDQETEARHVTLLTRDARAQKMTLVFRNGKLEHHEPSITIGY